MTIDTGFEADGYGLTVGYDLGGGAAVQLGYGDSTWCTNAAGVDTSFDTRFLRRSHELLIQPDQGYRRERALRPLFSFWHMGSSKPKA